jgi:hypothetical protein
MATDRKGKAEAGMPMTLDELAAALRGMPRDAYMLIQGQDGRLRPLLRVRGMHTAERPVPAGAKYAVVLVAGDPVDPEAGGDHLGRADGQGRLA